MKLTGRIDELNIDFVTGAHKLTLEINEKNDLVQCYDELKAVECLSIEMKPYRPRRSLDANAYLWVLLDKLAEKMNIPKDEIYRTAIKEIGGNSEIVCVKNEAVERLRAGWSNNGIGWQTDTMPSKIDGCTNVILYYGSSVYDSKQMGRLIDLIVSDCKDMSIPTGSPEEIERIKTLWGEK